MKILIKKKKLNLIYIPLFFVLFLQSSSIRASSINDLKLVLNEQYFQFAKEMIKNAKSSIYIMMFEIGYYERYPNTPSNLLINELIKAKRRGVKIEVILEMREGKDRTSERNRHTGSILSKSGINVIFDSPFKTTHAKWMVVDDELCLIGSTNWTFYALTNNNEVSVLFRSNKVAKGLIDYFNNIKASGAKFQE